MIVSTVGMTPMTAARSLVCVRTARVFGLWCISLVADSKDQRG
jgi:hypothetical protein